MFTLSLYPNAWSQVVVQPMGRSKAWHFEQLRAKTGFDYADMLFFDDNDAFIASATKIGVTAVRVCWTIDLMIRPRRIYSRTHLRSHVHAYTHSHAHNHRRA